ncbi:MAG: flavodoxin [Clostridia bacterium]|nr:flavodoxin [Clostridia bacterium]
MKKVAVVYWSGTGNTEQMAELVAAGAKEAGAEVAVFTAGDFDADKVADFDALAFGCSAQGDEVLEEDEFEPMFAACEPALAGKAVALFGSYGWGDGQWMRDWEERCQGAGITLAAESVICNDAPDSDGEAACKALGKALA